MVLSLLAQLVILLSSGCSKEDTLVEITDWAATENVSAEELDIELNVRDTWYEAPKLAVSADGFLIVAGRETDIVSTTMRHGLRQICVLLCREQRRPGGERDL